MLHLLPNFINLSYIVFTDNKNIVTYAMICVYPFFVPYSEILNKIFNTNQAILFKGKSMQCFIMIYHI